MVLSVFWICKQLSILRGMVYLLLLLGQLKRYRVLFVKIYLSSKPGRSGNVQLQSFMWLVFNSSSCNYSIFPS